MFCVTVLQTFHPAALKELDNQKDRKHPSKSDIGSECSATKQPKLSFVKPNSITQHSVHKLIVDYIVSEMHPLRTVDSESFQALVKGLCPPAVAMRRQPLHERINESFNNMKSNIQSELNNAEYICTTADI